MNISFGDCQFQTKSPQKEVANKKETVPEDGAPLLRLERAVEAKRARRREWQLLNVEIYLYGGSYDTDGPEIEDTHTQQQVQQAQQINKPLVPVKWGGYSGSTPAEADRRVKWDEEREWYPHL
jgi:hypothetical protein